MATSLIDKAISEFTSAVTRIVSIAIFAVVLLIAFVLSVYWWLVFTITPQADLPRDESGTFIVSPDNYRHWHTQSRIHHSKSDSAILEGDFIVRSVGRVSTTCDKIKNCDKYESQFHQYDMTDSQVYIIEKNMMKRSLSMFLLLSRA